MATATVDAYVSAAIDLLKATNHYLAIGKTTPWENETLPPIPDEDTQHLTELVGFKKMTRVSLCRPLADKETTNWPVIDYKGSKWVLVPEAEGYTQKAHYVYLEAKIEKSELPPAEYRQVGVYTKVPTTSATTSIENGKKGKLYYYDNRPRFNRTENVSITERFILNLKGNDM